MASSSSSSPPELPDWLALPREVTAAIIARLGAVEILRSPQFVCKSWYDVCKDPLVWLQINFFDIEEPPSSEVNTLDRMCRRAVDLCSGQLVGIGVSFFANDDLIRYIVDRCRLIKTLRLGCCESISGKSVVEATARLPLLEELDLTLCWFDGKTLESVGRSCPHLKSLKLNSPAWRPEVTSPEEDYNEEAMAIAENMPELRYLQLIGNPMTAIGLKAILAGCPRLESLDLRLCKYLFFSEKLAKSCAKIKCLRFPFESTRDWDCIGFYRITYEDYEYDYEDYDDGYDYEYESYLSGMSPDED